MNSFEDRLKKKNNIFKNIFIFIVSFTLITLAIFGGVFLHFSKDLPQIITIEDYKPLVVTRVMAVGDDGPIEVGEFFKERRYIIPYEKIPEHVIRAFISAEDDKFFEHPGINIMSMVRAGIANFKAGHVVQGGSTITQQVAKSLLLTPERSYDRKIKEVILASRIERYLTKKQILFLYLNQIYLGRHAYGVQAAGRAYFKKDVSELTVAEAALLAGLPQAPSKYSPVVNPKKAKERQLYVLRRMMENKFITLAQMSESAAQPLKLFAEEDLNQEFAPYYVEHVRRHILDKYGEKAVYESGLTVTVPLSVKLAQVASQSIQNGLKEIDKRLGYRGPIQNLKKSEDIEVFLENERMKMIQRKLHYQLFLPDGRLDSVEAMSFSGIESDRDLLEENETYLAVITGFDTVKKTAKLMIGAVRAILPIEQMKWAKPLIDDQNPGKIRLAPTSPQQIFKKGDVILVQLLKKNISQQTVNKDTQDTEIECLVSLEQTPQVQGALFSVDVNTGNVLAMVGGYDYSLSEFNRAIQALRQPGSTFKPVIYASALEKGFTPASIIVDSPIVFRDLDGTNSWKPNNYGEKFYGDTTFRQALIKSRNIPTVKIVQSIQIPFLIDYARRLGMTGTLSSDLSVALGSGSISVMDMTRVFALFPRLGKRLDPIFITQITDRNGKILEDNRTLEVPTPIASTTVAQIVQPDPQPTAGSVYFPTYPLANDPKQLMDPRVAYVMTHLMKEVVASGTGYQAKKLGKMVAGKTGTTNDSKDAWFVGFTPEIATGVWTGFDTQKSLGPNETGARAALPMWINFMQEAIKGRPDVDFNIPAGIVFANINAMTGKLAPLNSPQSIQEAFIAGTEPTYNSKSGETESDSQSEFFKEDRE